MKGRRWGTWSRRFVASNARDLFGMILTQVKGFCWRLGFQRVELLSICLTLTVFVSRHSIGIKHRLRVLEYNSRGTCHQWLIIHFIYGVIQGVCPTVPQGSLNIFKRVDFRIFELYVRIQITPDFFFKFLINMNGPNNWVLFFFVRSGKKWGMKPKSVLAPCDGFSVGWSVWCFCLNVS